MGGEQPPKRKKRLAMHKKRERETSVSQRLINFALLMYKQLTREQRYEISALLQNNIARKLIAETINVSVCTISRELTRNSVNGVYDPDKAHAKARKRKRRSPGNHAIKKDVWQQVERYIREKQWSPKQISGYLARHDISISHECIYQHIRRDKRKEGDLWKYCRHRLKHRSRPVGKKVVIPNRISISKRPQEADGKRFGDFEMDTIVGRNNQGAIVTLVERSTNMLFMKKLKGGKDARELANTVISMLGHYKKHVNTITTDNGPEFAHHEFIGKKLGTKVYFTDPYCSWQKGAIENANGLIRQYIRKRASFTSLTDEDIEKIRLKINSRPREKLKFYTPNECFYKNLS